MKPDRPEMIRKPLLTWYDKNRRDLPWRRTSDPYAIWVSEIMLQQTRVSAVIPYYERFLKRFPSVESLARAPEERLLAMWSGLGYYRRARQMRKTARIVASEFGGEFPIARDELLALPGIGPYTAAAVSSLARNAPHAVVDGNVVRVLTRLSNDDGDVARADVQRRIEGLAQALGEAGAPRRFGRFNQAMMELGATLCTPRNPRCAACPLKRDCIAQGQGLQRELPFKRNREHAEHYELAVAVVRRRGRLLMRQRPAGASLMSGFWELPAISATRLPEDCLGALGLRAGKNLGECRHSITTSNYRGSVYRAVLKDSPMDGYQWVPAARLSRLPLTTVTRKALAVSGLSPALLTT
jgi:A/G-specific adenine glycosylase